MKRAPRLVVSLALEDRPWIGADADTFEDEQRLWAWLDQSRALRHLATVLMTLADQREQAGREEGEAA